MNRFAYYITKIFMLMIGVTGVVLGQDEQPSSIQAKAKVVQGKVYLRWAPSNAVVWKLANDYGYTLEKVKIMEEGHLIEPDEPQVLVPAPLKPKSLDVWEPFAEEDDFVGVAAQAIFGESFDVEDSYSSEIARVINTSRELENRFTFAIYAADMSPKAAELSGLYFIDQEVYAGEKYLYKIYANVPESTYAVDTATVFIGLEDEQSLPKPEEVTVEFNDQVSLISWNAGSYKYIYNAYWVQRSENGIDFNSITDVPIVSPQGEKSNERIYKGDSLQSNGTIYYYRVVGIDAFGFEGPPSDVVDGTGLPAFRVAPTISGHDISDSQEVTLFWKVPQIDLSLLSSFSVARQSGVTRITVPIASDLPAQSREFKDDSPYSSNYYTVLAHDEYGRKITSFPYMVQLDDSIPPSRPEGLKGSISDKGIVELSWKENSEEDLMGYKIYKSNYAESSFVELPGEMTSTASEYDSISLNNLTEKIYYKVRAFDKRSNPSEFSEALLLEKPDLVPPVSPVFSNIQNDSLGILIEWENSPSEDTEMQLLYRRAANESDWTLVYEQKDGMSFFLDQESEHNVRYAYTVVAIDDDGLESVPAKPITMLRRELNPYPVISEFSHKINGEKKEIYLNWAYSHPKVVSYHVYKGIGEGKLQLYKELAANDGVTNEFTDSYRGGESLQYRVQALFSSGEKSVLSQYIKIEF